MMAVVEARSVAMLTLFAFTTAPDPSPTALKVLVPIPVLPISEKLNWSVLSEADLAPSALVLKSAFIWTSKLPPFGTYGLLSPTNPKATDATALRVLDWVTVVHALL